MTLEVQEGIADIANELDAFNNASDLTITVMPNNLVHLVWDPVELLLQKVVNKAPDEIDLQKMYEGIIKGDSLLVVIADEHRIIACNTLDIRYTSTGLKYLMIPLTSGTRLDDWMPQFLDLANALALEQGCKELRGLSIRPAWVRKLNTTRFNWDEVHTVIKCPVINTHKGDNSL